jgi:hypothetical protein
LSFNNLKCFDQHCPRGEGEEEPVFIAIMLSNMALQNSIQTRHDQIYKKSTEIISMIVAIIKLFVILPFGNKSDSHECLNEMYRLKQLKPMNK